eukprot:2394390-Rhodomonas_salina.1
MGRQVVVVEGLYLALRVGCPLLSYESLRTVPYHATLPYALSPIILRFPTHCPLSSYASPHTVPYRPTSCPHLPFNLSPVPPTSPLRTISYPPTRCPLPCYAVATQCPGLMCPTLAL